MITAKRTVAPAVFERDTETNKKSIYFVTSEGRLAQVWDTDRWNHDYPAEQAGQHDLRFLGPLAVFPTNRGNNKKSIYAVTADGRLAQIWDTDRWNIDFPAELAGHRELRFRGGVDVYPTQADANKKSIYAVTADGRLAQIWDTDRWHLDFPAELAGHRELRFDGIPAVYPREAAANKKSIFSVTTDGRLVQLWDTNRWNLDFPVELAGHHDLRFEQGVAVFPTDVNRNKKSVYAVTSGGRLAQIWDTDRWNVDFPAELAGQRDLRFAGIPAVLPSNAAENKKAIYSTTADGRLTQLWDSDRWNLDFPAELAGAQTLRFSSGPALVPMNPRGNKKGLYVVAADGRLAQIWDTDRWNIDFPGW